jgi:hypothetical protein
VGRFGGAHRLGLARRNRARVEPRCKHEAQGGEAEQARLPRCAASVHQTITGFALIAVARRGEAVVDAGLVTIGDVAGSGEAAGAGSRVGVGAAVLASPLDANELVGGEFVLMAWVRGGSSLLEASSASSSPAAHEQAIPSVATRTNRLGLHALPRGSSGNYGTK